MSEEPKKLPRHYWPIVLAAELVVMALGAAIGVEFGLNPYVAAMVAAGAFVLLEVWNLKRAGF